MATQILKALTATRIIAVDTLPEKFELARSSGAHETVLAGENAAAEIRELTHGLGANLVLDFVGAEKTVALAIKVARVQGQVTVVGC